jgi:uncharacterized membrane protein
MALSGSDGARAHYNLTRTAAAAENTSMYLALMAIGAMLGFVLNFGHGMGTLLTLLLGGFAGYALAELDTLGARGRRLEKEVDELKKRLAAVQGRQRESGSEPEVALESGLTGGSAPGVVAAPPSPDTIPPASMSGWSRATSGSSDSRNAGTTRAYEQGVIPNVTRGSTGEGPAPSSPRAPTEESIESDFFRVIREFFTGGNTVVRVGIVILFFGVAFLLRYVAEHSHIPIQFRLSGVACGGIALLALGWRLRARRPGYALTIQGGGVGILYLTTFAALRLYLVLPPAVAFSILVLLAAFSAGLAVVQNSQAFAVLAVAGGFLAPILASNGQGSHVALFSYYAVLNMSILAIAWYKSWRPLNFVGFAFTFIIGTVWGVLHYSSALFNSTEPFLVLFFLFYVAIAVLFSIRQPPQLRGYVDGTLVFGTPMAAFGYQSSMLYDRSMELALSAIVVGAFYLLLAWVLHRQRRESQRLLVEVFMALGVVFLTVAAPLGLDSRQTCATWALEGAALLWVGARQRRVLPRVLGVTLQVVAGIVLLSDITLFASDPPSLDVSFAASLGRVLAAVAAVFSAVTLRKYQERLRPFEESFSAVLFFFGLGIWVVAGAHEINRHVPAFYGRSAALVFAAATGLVCSELSRRTALSLARLPALWLLPAMIVLAVESAFGGVTHPAAYGGWLAWSLAFAAFYVICRRHEGEPEGALAALMHALSVWLLVALLTWELHWVIDRQVGGRGSWSAVGLMLVAACVLFALPRLVERVPWPLKAHRSAYIAFAGSGIAVYLAAWSIGANLSLTGDPYPFSYVPLLNALDLAEILALLVLWRFWRYFRSLSQPTKEDAENTSPVVILGALTFVWLNAALLRSLHQWAGVPFDFDAMTQSTLVQTAVSIFWTLIALATMLIATRRATRGMWVTGAVLLAVTIAKLFLVDLSRVGTIERIVSFVAVGLLTLVIGYFSPLPPVAREPRTSAS